MEQDLPLPTTNENRDGLTEPTAFALTPAEFAARFKKQITWAYRQIWAGRVRVIDTHGDYRIPVSEVHRLLASAHFYPRRKTELPHRESPTPSAP